MRITIIGTGYVGLVTGACLADFGHRVTCLDVVAEKIDLLRRGRTPIYEPDLEPLVAAGMAGGRLQFTMDAAVVGSSDVVFLTVGTPQDAHGAADLTGLLNAVSHVAPYLSEGTVVVIKSTVPVGTNAQVERQLAAIGGVSLHVVSNPEFLREGSAVHDLVHCDRIIVGVRHSLPADLMRELYDPVVRRGAPYLVMTPESAELTKYAANAMLAMKITFINEMAALCESLGAEIGDVRRGIGTDRRIGFEFLCPGPGYGGSCFPKDVRALQVLARRAGRHLPLVAAIDVSNERHKRWLGEQVEEYFCGDLQGRIIAVWGLAFKPGTDDIREAPALPLIDRLLKGGAMVRVHDPAAIANVRRAYGEALHYAATPEEALCNAAALVIVTDWEHYRAIAPVDIRASMANPAVFDGRQLFDPEEMQRAGVDYRALGCNHRQTPAPHYRDDIPARACEASRGVTVAIA